MSKINPAQFGEQLKMLMTASEITDQYQPHDGDREDVPDDHEGDYHGDALETDSMLYARKLRQARTRGFTNNETGEFVSLADSVTKDGVGKPVHLSESLGEQGRPQIVGGHHRISVMKDARPDDLIPVEHHRDFGSAIRSGRYS